MRSAAIGAAVGRELERVAEEEARAARDVELLHTAMDMQVRGQAGASGGAGSGAYGRV